MVRVNFRQRREIDPAQKNVCISCGEEGEKFRLVRQKGTAASKAKSVSTTRRGTDGSDLPPAEN